MRPMSATNRFN